MLLAEKVLSANAVDGELRNEDKLHLADILWQRPEPASRKLAIQLYEDIQKISKLSALNGIKLAKLYRAIGDWPKAREQMRMVLTNYTNSVEAREAFTRMLVERGDFKDAEKQYRKLNELAPNASETIELSVRILSGRGNKKRAAENLQRLIPKRHAKDLTRKDFQLIAGIADLQIIIGDHEGADRTLRFLVGLGTNLDKEAEKAGESNPNVPKLGSLATIMYIRYMGTYGDIDTAINALQSLWAKQKSPRLIDIGISMVRSRRETIGDSKDEVIDRMLKSALLENPDSITLLLQEATFRELQKKYGPAEKVYRRLLSRSELEGRARGQVLNNLAFLLALQGKQLDDAKSFVDKAVYLYGPTADMLDTRGVVKLALKDTKGAVEDLELAITDRPTAAKYFHLTRAYLAAGDNRRAIATWSEAVKKKIGPDSLSILELDELNRVESEMKKLQRGGRM